MLLIEYKQLQQFVSGYFLKLKIHNTMKILKFGGKSLSNGDGLNKVVAIITDKINQEEIAIVVSARGNATDELDKF
jgi:aspartokinase